VASKLASGRKDTRREREGKKKSTSSRNVPEGNRQDLHSSFPPTGQVRLKTVETRGEKEDQNTTRRNRIAPGVRPVGGGHQKGKGKVITESDRLKPRHGPSLSPRSGARCVAEGATKGKRTSHRAAGWNKYAHSRRLIHATEKGDRQMDSVAEGRPRA